MPGGGSRPCGAPTKATSPIWSGARWPTRPERPTIFAELRGHIREYPLRQRAKPGITGLAQINHHYDRSLDDVRTKVGYDLEYIRRQSLREDLRIMLKTIPVILLRRGGW